MGTRHETIFPTELGASRAPPGLQEIRQHGWEGVHALIFILAKLYALPALQREKESCLYRFLCLSLVIFSPSYSASVLDSS